MGHASHPDADSTTGSGVMTTRHFYIGIENLALNNSQKATLMSAIKALGPETNLSPARLNHWRTRLDNNALIAEALFDEDNLTVAKFKQRLANIFGVNISSIGHSIINHSFGGGTTPVVTFDYNGVDRLRVVLFGGTGASWNESGDEVRAYLANNKDDWETEVGE